MKDLEIAYNVIFDAIYNDKVRLEIELNKISDKRLVIGLLVDIYGKADKYEADKKAIIETLVLFADITPDDKDKWTDVLFEDNKYFVDQMKEYRKTKPKGPGMSVIMKAMLLATILKDNCPEGGKVDPEKVDKFVEEVKKSTPEEIEYFKSMLLDIESYETIVSIDNILKS